MEHHFCVIVILEDLVLFQLFIFADVRIRDNLLSWWLLYLVILRDINCLELFPTSTEICKQIRDISELILDVLNT